MEEIVFHWPSFAAGAGLVAGLVVTFIIGLFMGLG